MKGTDVEIPGGGQGTHRPPQMSRDSQNPVLEPFNGDFTEEAWSRRNWVWEPAKPVCSDSFQFLCAVSSTKVWARTLWNEEVPLT